MVGISFPALGGTWYVPMSEQVSGGFDHIQIRMLYPYQFDSPAMSAFFGADPNGPGEDWSQTFLNDGRELAIADGSDMGDANLYFSVWVAGDPQIDRPAFHFQTYRGDTRVDNADLIYLGPGETDWMVSPGTWTQNSPIPPFTPGDADRDATVGDDDLSLLLANWGVGTEWNEGDFNGDNDVDDDLSLLLANWNPGTTPPGPAPAPVPEPATLALTALGLCALAARRRKAK